jgi:CheY-like chemotaxis protein
VPPRCPNTASVVFSLYFRRRINSVVSQDQPLQAIAKPLGVSMATQQNAPIILCVDDDATGLRFRRLMLEANGYKVLFATSAQQGMEVFQSNPVDLVVADYLMGRAVGTDMAADLKRLRPHVPIVILSGSNSPPEGTQNADAYVCKSEGPDVLLNQIAALLASAASRRERRPIAPTRSG